MQTNEESASGGTGTSAASEPRADDSPAQPGPARWSRPPLLLNLAGVLLLLLISLVVILLSSTIAVLATSLVARWTGVSEVAMIICFVGLAGFLVLSLTTMRIESEIAKAGGLIEAAIKEAGDQVAAEVAESAVELTNAIDETPVVVIDPRTAPPRESAPIRGRKATSRSRR